MSDEDVLLNEGPNGEKVAPASIDLAQVTISVDEVANSPVHKECMPAVNMLWNNQFADAEKLLRSLPESPRNALTMATVVMMKSNITTTTEDREAATQLVQAADEMVTRVNGDAMAVTTIARRLAAASNINVDSAAFDRLRQNVVWDFQLVQAESKLYLSLVQFKMNSKLKGMWNLRKAFKQYQYTVAEIDAAPAESVDAAVRAVGHFGLGLFLFFVSMAPAGVATTLLSWIGFNGDRVQGLKLLREVYPLRGVSSSFAGAVLLANNVFFPRGLGVDEECTREAYVILRDHLDRFPNSSMFLLMDSHLARRQGEGQRAVESIQRSIDSAKACGISVPINYMAELGHCYFYNLDWENALQAYNTLLNSTTEEFDSRGITTVSKACALSMLGREREAEEIMRTVERVMSRTSKWDAIGSQVGIKSIQRGTISIAPFEWLWLKRDLVNQSPETIQRLLPLLEERGKKLDHNNPEVVAEYGCIRGAMLSRLGRYEDALAELSVVTSLEARVIKTGSKHYLPYACYEMAEILYKQERWALSYASVTRALGYSNYDWEDMMSRRLKRAQQQLKEEHPESV